MQIYILLTREIMEYSGTLDIFFNYYINQMKTILIRKFTEITNLERNLSRTALLLLIYTFKTN